MEMILTYNLNGFVSVCGVHIGITRKEAKDILTANGYDVVEYDKYILIRHVVFEKDLPTINNITFFTEEGNRISRIRIIANISEKDMAFRFYKKAFSITNKFGMTIDYKDKYTEDSDNQTTLFINAVNRVQLLCSCIQNISGEIDRSSLLNIVDITSYVNQDSDIKSVKEKYYKLLDDMSAKQFCKPIEKKSKLHSIYEKNKGTILVSICFLWSLLCAMGVFLYDSYSNRNSVSKPDSFYSSEKSDSRQDVVYICTSPNARKYHTTPSCRWLDNCSGDIKEVSLSFAERQGKTPCKGCQ